MERVSTLFFVRPLALKNALTGIATIIPPRDAKPEPTILINFITTSTTMTIITIYENISPIFILLVSV